MTGYIFHYPAVTSTQPITCALVEARFNQQAHLGGEDNINTPPHVDPPLGFAGNPDGITTPRDTLNDPNLWAGVARLQWRIVPDGIITPEGINTTLDGLTADGTLNDIRVSICRLITALYSEYPALVGAGHPAITQLVALGRDMAISAGEFPDLFEFIQKEFQRVDLAVLLRI